MKQLITICSLFLIFLSSCGQSHDRTDSANQQIIMADQTKIAGLANTLKKLKNGELEYDFFGLTSNGTDCLYFVYEKNGFNIEYEVMTEAQKPYFEKIKHYSNENNISVVETTYQNQPQYNEIFAPVLRLQINATLEQTEQLGQILMSTIFNNDDATTYDIVP